MWAPQCLANSVVIQTTGSSPQLAWTLFLVAGVNNLAPPVEYGVAKDGARVLPEQPAVLTTGTEYEVSVFVWDAEALSGFVRIGADTITP
jgi:hypothetical protein